MGQTGLGKSRILQAIGRAACVLGYRVRYATSAKLLQELTAALADGSFTRTLDAYARLDLLLIDEFGFDLWNVKPKLKPVLFIIVCSMPALAVVRQRWRPTSTSKPGAIISAIRR